MAFLFLQSLEDSIGRDGQQALLRSINPHGQWKETPPDNLDKSVDFSCFSSLCGSLEAVYGESSARRVVFRAARTAFSRAMAGWTVLAGMESPLFFSQAQTARIDQGLAAVVRLLLLLSDIQCSSASIEGTGLFWISACPECSGRSLSQPVCFGMAGLLRGALDWFGIEDSVVVAETHCMAAGSNRCEFTISENIKECV